MYIHEEPEGGGRTPCFPSKAWVNKLFFLFRIKALSACEDLCRAMG